VLQQLVIRRMGFPQTGQAVGGFSGSTLPACAGGFARGGGGSLNRSRVSLCNLPQHISLSPQPDRDHALQARQPANDEPSQEVIRRPEYAEQFHGKYYQHDGRHPMAEAVATTY